MCHSRRCNIRCKIIEEAVRLSDALDVELYMSDVGLYMSDVGLNVRCEVSVSDVGIDVTDVNTVILRITRIPPSDHFILYVLGFYGLPFSPQSAFYLKA
jgi:hypothetical protein